LASEVPSVDGEGGFLHSADVVDNLSPGLQKVGIAEVHAATGYVIAAGEGLPRILDQAPDGLRWVELSPHADHVNASDPAPLVRGVVALPKAQSLQAFSRKCGADPIRTTGFWLERADGAHAEARGAVQTELCTHMLDPRGSVHQVEPEEDPVSARAVDFAAFEGVPDGRAMALLCVNCDESASGEEARLALEIYHEEGR
jgi:hypothetical protein